MKAYINILTEAYRMGTLPNMLLTCGLHPDKVATAFSENTSTLSDLGSSIERLSSSTESTITFSTVESPRSSSS